jgi:GAF domain-containing protein
MGTGRGAVENEHRFLAEATIALTSSLDYEATLARIAHLAVPPLADWCSVDLLERDGAVRRIALACVDSLKHITAEVGLAYPPDPEGRHPLTQVLRTGRAILVRDVTDEMLAAITAPEHLRVMRALACRSAVIVPLIARGEIRGALTLATVERRYDERDLALAEELARRASIAVDNARLYRDAQEEIARRRAAERRLAAQHIATRVLSEAGTFADATGGILRALGEALGWEWAAL